MSPRIHRKQIIMLVLALLLAMASYLIPLPQPSGRSSKSGTHEPTKQNGSTKPVAVRETVIARQLPDQNTLTDGERLQIAPPLASFKGTRPASSQAVIEFLPELAYPAIQARLTDNR